MPRERSVPEHLQRGTPEHEPYEELCALAAGGLLEGAELVDFQAHMKDCDNCRADYRELSSLVTRELPQAQGKFRRRLTVMRAQPLAYSRQRFLRRARAEGVIFSPEVDSSAPSRPWYLRPVTILAPIAALVVVVGSLTVYHLREAPETARARDAAAAKQTSELKQENSALAASLSQLNEAVAASQREIQSLRAQRGAENPQRNEQAAVTERSSSRDAQLLDESRNQEKLLADAKDEAARINQLHLNDEASLVEQQTRITELSDKLRIASATLDQERQLAAAGKDVRELMAARQLHVIDVRDTDSNGKPGNAFGRVFLTEGKSLTFYAFDLNNEDRVENAKRSFQVWAVVDKAKDSARSLGLLHVDPKAPGRWVLKVDNPELVKEINAVFITTNPLAGDTEPSGQKMLYAYLGEANHP